jgi:hypothetical protein
MLINNIRLGKEKEKRKKASSLYDQCNRNTFSLCAWIKNQLHDTTGFGQVILLHHLGNKKKCKIRDIRTPVRLSRKTRKLVSLKTYLGIKRRDAQWISASFLFSQRS